VHRLSSLRLHEHVDQVFRLALDAHAGEDPHRLSADPRPKDEEGVLDRFARLCQAADTAPEEDAFAGRNCEGRAEGLSLASKAAVGKPGFADLYLAAR
jgi:hypothetical protein